jgi:hypothetical protein
VDSARGEIATDEMEGSGRHADLLTINKCLQLHSVMPTERPAVDRVGE